MFMYFVNQLAVKKLDIFEVTCFIIILDNNSFLLCGILLGLVGRGWLPAERPDWAIFCQLGYFWRPKIMATFWATFYLSKFVTLFT
jgi:hypothetical protein